MSAAAAEHPTAVRPRPSRAAGRNAASAVLGSAVVATGAGLLANVLRGEGSAINTYLFMERGLSHVAAARVEGLAVALVLLAAVTGLAWRRAALFLPAAAYLLTEAVARRYVQGQPFSDWALLADAARYAAPVAVASLMLGDQGRGVSPALTGAIARWILRLSLAAVFVAHGAEALSAHPGFIDYILSSAINLVHVHLTESTARAALHIIGMMDCAVAGALVLWSAPPVLAWAATWAAITAFSRITANGWAAYPDVLLRATYILGPLALWLLRGSPIEPGVHHLSTSSAAPDPTCPAAPIVHPGDGAGSGQADAGTSIPPGNAP